MWSVVWHGIPWSDSSESVAGSIASMDAKALPGNDSRYVQLKLSLKEVPDILLDHFGADDKYTLTHFRCPCPVL